MAEEKTSGCLKFAAFGCLAVVVLGLVGLYFLYAYRAKIAAGMMSAAADRMIASSGLPEEERTAVRAEVERVLVELREGNLSQEEMVAMFESVQESPLPFIVVLYGLQAGHIAASGLSAQEKAEAERTIQRLLRGASEETLGSGELQEILEAAPEEGQDLTDQQVRDLLAVCKQIADDAQIPDTTFEIDVVGEVRRAVDAALAQVRSATE